MLNCRQICDKFWNQRLNIEIRMQLKKALNPTVLPRIVLLLLFPPQKRCRQQGHTSPPSNHAKSRNISKESIFHSALQSIA